MSNYEKYLDSLIEKIKLETKIENEIPKLLKCLPRHMFLPYFYRQIKNKWHRKAIHENRLTNDDWRDIYSDISLPLLINNNNIISTISQPSLVVDMLNISKIIKGNKVMEIGTGSGYNCSLISLLTGPGNTFSIEIQNDIFKIAKNNIYNNNISAKLFLSDGIFGLQENSPFDVIVVTTSSSDISKYWISQLKVGGRLLLPYLFKGIEILVSLKREGNGYLKGSFHYFVSFTKLDSLIQDKNTIPININKFNILRGFIDSKSERDNKLEFKLSSHSKFEILNFLFFIALNEPLACRIYINKNISYFGILSIDLMNQGFALIKYDKNPDVIYWGNDIYIKKLNDLYDKWLDYGYPGIADYSAEVTPKDIAIRNFNYFIGGKTSNVFIKRKKRL